MKIELIKEIDNGNEWYEIRFDGKYITGSSNYESAINKYNEFTANPSSIGKQKIVLKSDEIDVTLQQTNL